MGRVMNEANELRAKLEAQAKALGADGDAFKQSRRHPARAAALKADLEATEPAAAADAALKADLEQAMVRAHEIAKENAIKMVKHNERMGRWRSTSPATSTSRSSSRSPSRPCPASASPWSARGTTGTSPGVSDGVDRGDVDGDHPDPRGRHVQYKYIVIDGEDRRR